MILHESNHNNIRRSQKISIVKLSPKPKYRKNWRVLGTLGPRINICPNLFWHSKAPVLDTLALSLTATLTYLQHLSTILRTTIAPPKVCQNRGPGSCFCHNRGPGSCFCSCMGCSQLSRMGEKAGNGGRESNPYPNTRVVRSGT